MRKSALILASLLIGAAAGSLATFMYANQNGHIVSSTSNLERKLNELGKDKDFYANFQYYAALLNADELKYYREYLAKNEEEITKNLEATMTLLSINEIYKDDRLKSYILDLRDRIYEKQSNNKDFFERNTACGNLANTIQSKLAKDEKLDFVFYSPEKNTCIYATNYSFSSSSLEDFYTYEEKRLYDGSTHVKIGSYRVYALGSPYLSENEENAQEESARVAYIKYILENSGFNVELLKDISYVYGI
ncbi:MAG: hypothetical protein G01um10148_735 [Parcubacteria group bacterium Gr01-1014_8]|nr:MAG: hypothetical protein G01um10148_735 [Parcubacteria group bacterium Gr01-1014_8]